MIRLGRLVVVVLCGLSAACSPPPGGDPVAPVPASFSPSPWAVKLAEAPVRGGLADSGFAAELADLLPTMDIAPSIKLLFADDVGRLRIAIGVSKSTNQAVYLAAPRVASAAEMIGDAAAEPVARPFHPLLGIGFVTGSGPVTEAGVALTPPGCVVSSARRPVPLGVEPEWAKAATLDYLTWEGSAEPILLKVDCLGTTRYRGPALQELSLVAFPLAETAVDAATTAMRGSVPRDVAKRMLQRAMATRPAGPVRFVFGGSVAGDPAPIYVAVAPMTAGQWAVLSTGAASEITVEWLGFNDDPLGPKGIVVLRRQSVIGDYLVIAPPQAVRVDLLDVGGSPLAGVGLTDGIGWIKSVSSVMGVLAYDGEGRHITTGVAPPQTLGDFTPMPDIIDRW